MQMFSMESKAAARCGYYYILNVNLFLLIYPLL